MPPVLLEQAYHDRQAAPAGLGWRYSRNELSGERGAVQGCTSGSRL
jgi:hypothetical protein